MKHFLYIIIALSILLTACSHCEADKVLNHAEAIMEEYPDSALAMLDTLSPSILTTDATRAKYALLLTQAKFKNNVDVDDDSLISMALDYYNEGNDYYNMLSNYYYGRVKYNNEDYATSLVSMFKAIDCCNDDKDAFWQGMIYRTISDIYLDTYNNAEELEYAKKEYEYFNKSGRQPHIDYAMCDLARAYNNAEEYDSAIIITNKILDVAKIEDDPNLYLSMQRIKALAYYAKGNYQRAMDEYYSICASGIGSDLDSAYLGLAYLKDNNLTKAQHILDNLEITPEPVILNLQYLVYEHTGHNKEALAVLMHLNSVADKKLSSRMTKNITTSLVNQLRYSRDLAEARNKADRQLLLLVIILVIILIILFWQFFNSYRKRKSAEIERNIEFAQQIQEMLDKRDKEFIDAQQSINVLIESKYDMLDKFCTLIYEGKDSAHTKRKIASIVDNLIADISNNPKKKQELISIVDTHYSGLYSDFCKDFPGLKNKEYELFLYSVLGFSSNAIALFLQAEKVSSVYNMRRHLKDKIRAFTKREDHKYLSYL